MAGEHIDGFTIDLGIDTSDVDRGMANLQRKLKTADAQMKANLSTFNKVEKSVDKFETQLDGLNKSMTQQARAVDKSKEKLDKLKGAQDKTTESLKKAGIEADKVKQKHERLTNEYEDINKVLKEHKANVKSAQDAQKQMQNTVTALSAKTKNAKSSLDSLSNELKELEKDTAGNAGEISDLTFEIGRAEREYKKLSTSLDGATRDLNESKAATASAKNELENFSNANKEAMASAKTAMSEAKKQADSAERSYAKLNREVGELPSKLDKAEKEVYEQALAYNVLQNRIDETTDELKELNRQQTFFGKMSLGIKSFDERWQAVNAKINKIGDSFRNVGYVAQGVINGILIQNISTIIPVAGAATSAVAGIGGAAVAAGGGAIGLAGVYGTALGGVSIFAGMAASSLKRLEDGTLKITGEVTRYQGALESLKNTWNGLADRNQANIFNTITNGIRIAILSLQRLTPAIDSISGIISKATLKMFEWVQNSKNANQVFTVINSTAPPIFQNLVNAIMKVTDGLAHMFVQFAPLFTWVGTGIESLATKFSKWANSASTDSSTAKFIQYTKTNLPIVGAIFGNIFGGIIGLIKAFSGHSHTVLIGMQNVTKTFKEWGQSLSSSDKFKAFIDYLNTNGPIVWQLLKNIGSILVGLVQGMAPIGAIMLRVTTSITGFISKIVNSSPAVGAFIGILSAIVGGLMALVPPIALARTVFGGLGGAAVASGGKVGFMSKALGVLRGAFRLLLGPWGLAIAALVGGFVLAYKKSETFRNTVNRALESVKNTFSNVATIVKGFFQLFQGNGQDGVITLSKILPPNVVVGLTNFANAVKTNFFIAFNALKAFGTQVSNQLSTAWAQISNSFKKSVGNNTSVVNSIYTVIKVVFTKVYQFINWIMPALKIIVKNSWQGIKQIISGALDIIIGVIKVFSVIFTGDFKLMWSGIKQIFRGAIKIVVGFIRTSLVGQIIALIRGFSSNIKGYFSKMWATVKSIFFASVNYIYKQVRLKFNQLYRSIRAIFSSVSKYIRVIWSSIKKSIVKLAISIWTNVKSKFNGLYKSVKSIFNNVSKFSKTVWNNLKNAITKTASNLWKNIKNKFNGLYKSTRSIFNSLSKFARNLWTNLKNAITKTAQNLWNNVRNRFTGMYKSIRTIFTNVKNSMVNKWREISSSVTGIASNIWKKVGGTFRGMRDGLKGIIGKIKSHINGMVTSVKKGLNKLIEGVNWVAGKIGMDKLPKFKLSTGTTHTQTINRQVKTTSDGRLKQPTRAIVGDRGRGNGPGGFRNEMIEYPNGKFAMTPSKDTEVMLPKNARVHNGTATYNALQAQQAPMPRFSTGTLPRFKLGTVTDGLVKIGLGVESGKAKAKQKKKEVKAGAKATIDGGKKYAKKKTGEALSYAGDKAGEAFAFGKDIYDWASNPGKLVNKVLSKFGVNFDFAKGDILGGLMKAAYKKLQGGVSDLFGGWLEDSGGGDGSSFMKFKETVGYSPNKPLPGYPYNGGRHWGRDYATPIGTPLEAPTKGTVSRQHDHGGGLVARLVNGKFAQYFLHLSKILKTGPVKKGEKFAETGNSGAYTWGPHVHYQVEKGPTPSISNSNTIDPLKFLKGSGGGNHGSGSGAARSIIKSAQNIMGGKFKSGYVTEQMMRLAKRESNYDVNSINNWDSNAMAGNPSRGMFQMIKTTFDAYKTKGHGNYKNPVDQATAVLNYINKKYTPHYGFNGAFKRSADRAYATGGLINQKGMYNLAEGGFPEYVIPTDPKRRTDAMKLLALAGQDIQKGKNKRPNQLKTPKTNNSGSDDTALLLKMIEGQQQQIALLAEMVKSNQEIASKDYEPSISKYPFEEQVKGVIDKYDRTKQRAGKFGTAPLLRELNKNTIF
ncbi:peptidoglycan DD-metalloendopeptidase family protein [Mammaliicoccus vitulinus]|uniref:lysostaphin n=1 Tax=Mammaliicoccus vitulinus TaxID=71237 RepID=A0ABX7HFV1_9STAP|nr:peptidoglycan DD-metalloendopeptidase family protein [Mammaliicoccus vitulinus]PNZ38844.1 peptidase M23 [Mammaliicoccus vitulinus]QRO85122.1 peptidoglycan DD-metalloendopeptidase family protein [Mammaliicoccus vitulinus]